MGVPNNQVMSANAPMSDLDMQRHLNNQQQWTNGKRLMFVSLLTTKVKFDLFRSSQQLVNGFPFIHQLSHNSRRKSLPYADQAAIKLVDAKQQFYSACW